MKIKSSAILTVLVSGFIAFLPKVHAVSPAPEGGYPGGNTAEGQNALFSLTSGGFNTAVGFLSLRSNIVGGFNTAIGAGTLLANTADQNTATGAGALLSNTTGVDNTADGAFALFSNTTGPANTANGFEALVNNTTGSDNTANGYVALFNNTTGNHNTANGSQALYNNTTGVENTAAGFGALYFNTGDNNTATGFQALNSNTTGAQNTAIGVQALYSNTILCCNTAIGYQALQNTTGVANTALGANAGLNVTTASNVIAIGAFGANVNNSCFIGNIRGVTTANADAIPVLIDSAGQLGTMSSSRRFKHEIKSMDKASEGILALKPVTFHYKSDTKDTPQFGLIAEEVAAVNPDLVVRDKNGEIYTVRYDAVNAMLLNEFLKEHRKVEAQEATITQLKQDFQSKLAEQQRQIKALASGLEKVSAQLATASPSRGGLEMSKPASKIVLNDQ
jgi:hypothetical protein